MCALDSAEMIERLNKTTASVHLQNSGFLMVALSGLLAL